MGEAICGKCGAKNPTGAKFCSDCGGPVQVKEMQQPMEQIDGIFEKLFSKTLIVVGILVGILLIWIGSIVTILGASLDAYKASIVLSSLGIAAMGVFLVGGGIANKNIDKYVRLAMIIGGVLLLTGLFSIATLGLSSGSSSLSSLFGSY
jgi:hypothetical protein